MVHKCAETSDFTVIDLKSMQNPLYFEHVSNEIYTKPLFWVISQHVCAPFVKKFSFFIFGFFPEPRYDARDVRNRTHVTQSPRTRKTARVDSKIPE